MINGKINSRHQLVYSFRLKTIALAIALIGLTFKYNKPLLRLSVVYENNYI